MCPQPKGVVIVADEPTTEPEPVTAGSLDIPEDAWRRAQACADDLDPTCAELTPLPGGGIQSGEFDDL